MENTELIAYNFQVLVPSGVKWNPGSSVNIVTRLWAEWHEADHSPLSNAKVKNAWSYTFTLPIIFMAWCLIKQWIHLHSMVFS
jgi:hypothetical protein